MRDVTTHPHDMPEPDWDNELLYELEELNEFNGLDFNAAVTRLFEPLFNGKSGGAVMAFKAVGSSGLFETTASPRVDQLRSIQLHLGLAREGEDESDWYFRPQVPGLLRRRPHWNSPDKQSDSILLN